MSDEDRWVDPPELVRGPVLDPLLEHELNEVKKNPGKWRLVEKNVSQNRVSIYKRRGCKTTQRSKSRAGVRYTRGNVDIYALWPEEEDGRVEEDRTTAVARDLAPRDLSASKPGGALHPSPHD